MPVGVQGPVPPLGPGPPLTRKGLVSLCPCGPCDALRGEAGVGVGAPGARRKREEAPPRLPQGLQPSLL